MKKDEDLDLQKKPLKNPQIKWRKEEGEVFLVFNPETELLHTLRPLGIKILELCDGEHSIQQIIQQLSAEGLAKGENVEGEIMNFLSEVQKRRIISII